MRLVYSMLFLSFLSCGKNKKSVLLQPNKSVSEKKIEVRADSLNKTFLSKAVLDTALFYNNSPAFENEFLLNEKALGFFYKTLNNFFTEEEKKMPILIKELTWKINEMERITTFYVEKDSVFVPFEVLVYDRSTQY